MDSKVQTSVLGASGEYFVLSMLLRKGFIAGKTPDFTKDFDLIIVGKDGKNSLPIQVKTSRFPDWQMSEKHEKAIENLFFCFLYINEKSDETELFIIDAKKVSFVLEISHRIWLKLPGMTGNKHNSTVKRSLQRDFSKISMLKKYREMGTLSKFLDKSELKFINNHSDGWIEKYRDAWHLLENQK